jgi:hypothetical protein
MDDDHHNRQFSMPHPAHLQTHVVPRYCICELASNARWLNRLMYLGSVNPVVKSSFSLPPKIKKERAGALAAWYLENGIQRGKPNIQRTPIEGRHVRAKCISHTAHGKRSMAHTTRFSTFRSDVATLCTTSLSSEVEANCQLRREPRCMDKD